MAVINWFKDTLDSGHKLFLRSLRSTGGQQSQQKQQIISEQRALAEHFRKSSARFIEKLENITNKIAAMDEGGNQAASYIKQRQQALFYACLRLEIALKSNAELRRERKEWERRLPTEAKIDAYHPLVRIELIDSELRVREERLLQEATDVILEAGEHESAVSEATPIEEVVLIEDEAAVRLANDLSQIDALELPEQDHIVRQAEGLLIEISEQHNNTGSKEEYLQKTQELRELHKILRKMQKNNRYQNYRVRLRERMNQLFS